MHSVLIGTRQGVHRLGSGASGLNGREVTALARSGAGWLALAGGHELWSSPDVDGTDWARVADLGPGATCVLALNGSVLAGTRGAHLVRVESDAVEPVASFETVEGRDRWYTPWGAPADTRSLALTAGGVLLVGVHVGGIVRSPDGQHWEPTIDIDSDVHQVLAHPADAQTVVAATAVGLARSTDGCDTWDIVTSGLHATYSRSVAIVGATVLCSVSNGPDGGRSALYRMPLAGDCLERCSEGLPPWFSGNVDTGLLAAGADVAVVGTPEGTVFVSADEGRSWSTAATGLPPVTCVAVAS